MSRAQIEAMAEDIQEYWQNASSLHGERMEVVGQLQQVCSRSSAAALVCCEHDS